MAVLALVGLALTGPSARSAEAVTTSDALFSFPETSMLATSCADLVKGVDVEVRNDSAKSQTLRFRFGPVSNGAGATELGAVCGGLSGKITKAAQIAIDGHSATVDPGASATITLAGVSVLPRASARKTFTTTLVVFADQGLVSRRDLRVSETKGVGVDATPLADSPSVTHQRYNPHDDWQIWLPVSLAPGQTPSLMRGQSVGVLTGDAGTTDVTYEGGAPRRLSDTAALLPLHVDPVGAGTYSGKLTLATGATTTVALTVKHWWLIAGLVLFGGILLALVIQRYNGFWAPRGRLFQRIKDIDAEHTAAVTRLKEAAGTSAWKDFDLAGLAGLETALRTEIDNKTKGRSVFQIDQKLLDALDAKIDELQTKVDLLDKLSEAATNLDEALATLDVKPSDLPPLQGSDRDRKQPALTTAAHALERGTALSADDLSARVEKLKAMSQTVTTLHDDQHELALYWSQAHELAQGLADTTQLKEVQELEQSLIGVRHALWTGDSDDSLDVRGALDDARATIEKLWPELPQAPELKHFAAGGGGYFPLEGIEAVDGEPESVPAEPALSPAAADKIIKAAVWRQFAVILASTAVALVTGINALYVGKPWGTPWDYVTAVFWGLMTQAVITALAGAVDGLGPLGALRFSVGAHPKSTSGSARST